VRYLASVESPQFLICLLTIALQMEIRKLSRWVKLLSFFLVHIAHAADPSTVVGSFPICAVSLLVHSNVNSGAEQSKQACIASAFSICSCPMLDFQCKLYTGRE
jgi:hypothetical protein